MTNRNDLEYVEAAEAKEIVRLLKKMGRPQVECAPPSFQTKVLARLEEKSGNRQRYTWAFGYQVPVALAAGLILGIGLGPIFLEYGIEKSPIDEPEPMHFRGPNGVLASPDKDQSPEEWLESIAELLVTGQVNKASQQLMAFRQQYPRYEQDSATP